MKNRRPTLYALACLIVLRTLWQDPAAAAARQADPPPESLAIEHVTVLPMTAGGAPILDATVLIRDGSIAAVAPTSQTHAPRDARRIDGRGKWLMPGLTDMHVHLENVRMLRLILNTPSVPQSGLNTEDVFTPYIANGVLQVFVLQAMSETLGQRVEVEAGRVLGPRIVAAAMIDGPNPIWPVGTTRVAATPDAGRQAVRDAAAEGYDAIKVYSRLNLETFRAIVDEARQRGLPVVGHLPGRESVRTEDLFVPGFRMVAHAEEFAFRTSVPSVSSIPQYVEMMKRNGAWLTATLSLDERLLQETSHPESLHQRPEIQYLYPTWRDVVLNHNSYVAAASPERIEFLRKVVEFNSELTRAFVAAGIPVVAGTDAPVPGIVPGFSLHDELISLTRAGMSSRQALEAATRLPCEWLGVASEQGTVETGKRADLLLLNANPLEAVDNTRRISAVILGGRYLSREFLDQRMKALAER